MLRYIPIIRYSQEGQLSELWFISREHRRVFFLLFVNWTFYSWNFVTIRGNRTRKKMVKTAIYVFKRAVLNISSRVAKRSIIKSFKGSSDQLISKLYERVTFWIKKGIQNGKGLDLRRKPPHPNPSRVQNKDCVPVYEGWGLTRYNRRIWCV